ncbi:unnamed protein product [Plutella xylostella]|uniref:(diamondback moth) hypothetical protein n=1 Tax=Plutella xylostella TaxID=51655 RepID=A0A8S4F7B5_PLUXY|nr:unnamed protein product [Plutella xylostella]
MMTVSSQVSALLQYINAEASHYRSGHIVLTMGGDFTYQDAGMWYTNLDKLIEHTNRVAEGKVHLFYSTPNCYLKAVHDANPTLPTKRDDFFPYASDPNSFWTGYFTSKPTIKLYEREGNSVLQRDDFSPYASDPNSFWTGYFTSKPTIKLYEREGNNVLQVSVGRPATRDN